MPSTARSRPGIARSASSADSAAAPTSAFPSTASYTASARRARTAAERSARRPRTTAPTSRSSAASASSPRSVAPAYRRQGLGRRLGDEVERFAATARVRWVETETLERELAASLPLLRKRGFTELERYQTSRQKPAAVNLSRLDELGRRLRDGGIETVALPEIDGERTRQELYRCNTTIWRDMPHEAHVEWQDPLFETFTRSIYERPAVLLDSFFVARDGEHIVGLSYLLRRPDGDAEVGDTGVLSSHRRRGIARLLKMLVTRYAAQQGIPVVHTDNRADNAGMLAINRELGFQPGEVVVIMEKTMTSPAAI